MEQNVTGFWRRGSVQLAAVLFVGGLLAVLFSFEGGTTSGNVRETGGRKTMVEPATTDLNGKPWSLSDHKGEVVLLNVWASWCPPCRAETPGLIRISNEYRDKGFQVVGMSMDDGPEPVRRFVEEFHVPYTIVMPAPNSPLAASVEGLPTSFLLDRQGRVAKVYSGAVTDRQLRGDVEHLLGET